MICGNASFCVVYIAPVMVRIRRRRWRFMSYGLVLWNTCTREEGEIFSFLFLVL